MTAPSAGSGTFVLRRDDAGQFLLSAEIIAARFGWRTQTLRDIMRRGRVTSLIERGERKDAGL